jgi:hypothetical protein
LVGSLEPDVGFDDVVSSDVCEGVDDAPVSEGVGVESSVVDEEGGSVDDSDWEALSEGVGVESAPVVLESEPPVDWDGNKSPRPPESAVSSLEVSCRTVTTRTTLFLAAACPWALWSDPDL